MTTITPQPPPPPTPPTTAPKALPSVIVANPPEALTKLVAGTQFEGTVSTAGTKTAIHLTTVYGTLQIQTTLPLDKGAKLNLVLQNLTPQVQLQVATINGKPPHIALRGLASPAAQPAALATWPSLVAGSGDTVGVGPASLPGSATLATLLRPPAILGAPLGQATPAIGQGAAAVPQPGVPAGTAQPASPAPNAAPTSATPTIAPPSGPAAPSPAAPSPVVQGSQVPVRITAVRLPQPGTPMPVSPAAAQVLPAAGQTMTATVSGSTAQGQAVFQTPLGPVTLGTAASLPRGTVVTLEITGGAVPPEAAKRPPVPLSPLRLFHAQDWPTLREAFQVLQQVNPEAAHHLATQTIPRPDGQLAANLLFFISALRGGDIGGWLGEQNLRDIQRTRPEVASRLGEEFRQIGTFSRENLIGDWRVVLIPFFNGQDPEQVRLFLKPYGGGDEDEDSGPQGVRFVIDVDLSRLGHMQLDGLVRDDKKRLDLIVRSEQPLPAAMQNDIRAIFENAAELTGVNGGVNFQAAPPDFVEIAAESPPLDSPGIVA